MQNINDTSRTFKKMKQEHVTTPTQVQFLNGYSMSLWTPFDVKNF